MIGIWTAATVETRNGNLQIMQGLLKKGLQNNIEESNNNDDITEALNNHCDNSICLLV